MSDKTWTVQSILDWCTGFLERAGIENARHSAQWLLSEALDMSRIDLYTNFDKPLSEAERATMRDWVRRRAAGEPLQLISGKAPFRYLTIQVAEGVLIPRPETEVLVSEAFNELSLPRVAERVAATEEGECIVAPTLPALRAVDLCTGSGCIACALATEYPAAQVLALDISPEALDLASRNVEVLGVADRVEVRESDLLSAVSPEEEASYNLIISNPPYIPSRVVEELDREVTDYEPALALDGGEDGLDLYRAFLPDALRLLAPDGVMAVELHETCLDEAVLLAEEAGFDRVRKVQDLAGRDRALIARKPA